MNIFPPALRCSTFLFALIFSFAFFPRNISYAFQLPKIKNNSPNLLFPQTQHASPSTFYCTQLSLSSKNRDIAKNTYNSECGSNTKIYWDVAIPSSSSDIGNAPLGRLTFQLTPATHPNAHLPLHTSNLITLASGQRRSIDPKATYVGCTFQYSPATIEDGSFRYRWGHVCDGYGRNGVQTTLISGKLSGFDQPFADPERLKECTHKCFGGVYYGWRYEEILDEVSSAFKGKEEESVAVLLTVPIHGPGAGTSKFSIVRVSESPKEWGKRLLLNSAVVGYLDCNANGIIDGPGEYGLTSLDVLRLMARQRMGPPKIVNCGVILSGEDLQ